VRITDKLSKYIRDKKGETLVETLAAMLIVVMAFTILAGALSAASNINMKINENTAPEVNLANASMLENEETLTIKLGDVTTSATVELYKASSTVGEKTVTYYYYSKK